MVEEWFCLARDTYVSVGDNDYINNLRMRACLRLRHLRDEWRLDGERQIEVLAKYPPDKALFDGYWRYQSLWS